MVVNMGDMLESFLRVAMVVFIVGPLTAWVARRGARERSEATDSLDRFTVRMPAAIRTIIACCAVAFELIMLGVYVWQGVSLGEWDHELVWFGHAMALVFSLVIAFMAVFTDAGARLLLLVPCLFLFIGGLLPLLMLSMPARGIHEIGRQERELGFSFAEEMASRGATGTSLVDDDWFIEISNARVVAFRRDYLKKVTAHEDSESGDRCTVTTKGGRKIKVYAAGSTLEDLRSWFKQGAKARSTLDRAEDALETTSDWVVCQGFKYGKGRCRRPLSHQARGPAKGPRVDMSVGEEGNAFVLEQRALRLGPAEGETLREASVGEYDAMAGDGSGFRIDVQGVSHVSGSTGLTNELGDLTIRGNHAAGHLAHHVVYAVEESVGVPVCHAILTSDRYRHCGQERRPACAERLSKEVLREGREGATFVSKVFNSPVPLLS